MGFPGGYIELTLPSVFMQLLSMLGFMRKLITLLLCYIGVAHFLEADIAWPEIESVWALLIRETLPPPVKFSEVVVADPPESCAVCLCEFSGEDEIRRLSKCQHIFHKGCVDRWMGRHQRTCPLCRTPFIPHHIHMHPPSFNHSFWAASGLIPDFSYHY
ncbi:hypothetical protein RJT34_05340 [Clitoria ternatea]|uniref:RING-type domain-containing protein n=1 Tax=Clitoria ternatea TaxID=43366 RepID=A0AAN9K310_CLITE